MDSQKRKRLIIQYSLKLKELKEGRDTSASKGQRAQQKSRVLKTESSMSMVKQPQQIQMPPVDDIISKGECKLIFLQTQSDDTGFRTFNEMMRTNSSWLTQADKLANTLSSPLQLKNRLQFNHSQALKFKNRIEQKWNMTVKEVADSIIQKQEQKDQQKIKLVHLKINHTDADDVGPQQEECSSPSLSQEVITTNLKFFWFHISISDWKPPIREGCTVTYIQNLNKCIMYGGIGNDLFKTFVTLNTQSWVWKDIGTGVGDVPLEGRFGHTATLYKQQLIIYGGEKKYNSAMKMRECYGDVRIFTPSDKTWIQLKPYGDVVEGRRNHCAEVVGKYFIVYGGINSYGKVLTDVAGLNLETCKWTSFQIENSSGLEGVSDATSLAMFKSEVKMENPYFSYEWVKKKGKSFLPITTEGIYVFGGRLQNGEAVNDLRIVQFGFKPIKITKVKTKGQAPLARYSHSMNYFRQTNVIIIYGGRNDSKQGNILNDIFVLQIQQFSWSQVQQIQQLKHGKCRHSSVSIDSKILIFGGYAQHVFANADIQLLELDQNKVAKMIKDNKNNKNRDVVIHSDELVNNNTLKVFKTEYYNEAEDPDLKQKKIQENEFQRLCYSNFKSFMPLPQQNHSSLVNEYKNKREQAKLEILKNQFNDLSRRNSRRTTSDFKIIEQ
ncbi:unnamed protein product [Paramecium octaurelia]|uniref:Kelch motif family protein n=1 Tax=Paramecium octaurelia TaxID=43137 RepID=A0A8S1VF89_PAROT|nr:unnamed protein product [Paramecium octaurelia]